MEEIRSVFLREWHEYAVFNTRDVDNGSVIAQGQISGKFYIITLDDTYHVITADIHW